jgi:hypothetical protein
MASDPGPRVAADHRLSELRAVQRYVVPGVTVHGPIPPDVALTLQTLVGNQAVRNMLGGEGRVEEGLAGPVGDQEAPIVFSQEEIDEIVSATIAETLEAYNSIPVTVREERPLPGAAGGGNGTGPTIETTSGDVEGGAPPAAEGAPGPATETVTKETKVRAVYYINATDKELSETRKQAGFGEIVKSLGDQTSELNGKDGRLSAGNAVRFGKASPEDLALFVNKAVKSGSIHKYAVQTGRLGQSDLLVDLGDEALQQVIQDWMYHVKAGVDCSGLVNIALVRAREKLREQMRAAGTPEEDLPRSLARGQRPYKGQEVTRAADLRPGDLWVTNKGKHVRVVMEVYESTDKRDRPVIEFLTAESATSDSLGPTDKRWRTASMDKIQKITNIEGKGPSDGDFYRVKESRKKKK